MNSIIDTLRRELKELNAELSDIYDLSEEAACECYNVDRKAEIIEIMNDEIKAKSAELEEAEWDMGDDDDSEIERPYHFAFRTEASYWAYKGY